MARCRASPDRREAEGAEEAVSGEPLADEAPSGVLGCAPDEEGEEGKFMEATRGGAGSENGTEAGMGPHAVYRDLHFVAAKWFLRESSVPQG